MDNDKRLRKQILSNEHVWKHQKKDRLSNADFCYCGGSLFKLKCGLVCGHCGNVYKIKRGG